MEIKRNKIEEILMKDPNLKFPCKKEKDAYAFFIFCVDKSFTGDYNDVHYEIRFHYKEDKVKIMEYAKGKSDSVYENKDDIVYENDVRIQMHFENSNDKVKEQLYSLYEANREKLELIKWRDFYPSLQLKKNNLTTESTNEEILKAFYELLDATRIFNWNI